MRPSTGIHCVIPHLFPTPRLQANISLVARGLQPISTSHFPSQSRKLHHRPSIASHPRQKWASRHTQQNHHFPAVTSSHPQTSSFTTSPTMASDDAYMSFLDKANADLNAGRATQQDTGSVRTETVDASVQIPAPLQTIDAYYISETDEPFEPVVLRWEGATKGVWPSAGMFLATPCLPCNLHCLPARIPAHPCTLDDRHPRSNQKEKWIC